MSFCDNFQGYWRNCSPNQPGLGYGIQRFKYKRFHGIRKQLGLNSRKHASWLQCYSSDILGLNCTWKKFERQKYICKAVNCMLAKLTIELTHYGVTLTVLSPSPAPSQGLTFDGNKFTFQITIHQRKTKTTKQQSRLLC